MPVDARTYMHPDQRGNLHRPSSMDLPEGYRTSAEVLEVCGGRITYRQLDYWLRTGKITCELLYPGSGGLRGFSSDDVRCLLMLLEQLEWAKMIISSVDSGDLWRSLKEEGKK
jgi:hypothetical protein